MYTILDLVRDKLIYEPDTGYFFWKANGQRAGNMNHHGYRRIHLDKNYAEHRLAWLCVYGHWPAEIDHVNGVKYDNRLCNLQEVSRKENMRNARSRIRWSAHPRKNSTASDRA